MDARAANRLAMQRINRSLNSDEAAAVIRVSGDSLLRVEHGQFQRVSPRPMAKMARWERRWAYEEVRRALFGTEYEHKGTLSEAARVRVALAKRITKE